MTKTIAKHNGLRSDLDLARQKLNAIREACEALQSKHPNVYLLDEEISVENAQDSRVQDGHRRFANENEAYWTADECREVARHMVADITTRCAEEGIVLYHNTKSL